MKWHIYYNKQLIGTLKQIPSCKTEHSNGEPLKFFDSTGKERSTHSAVIDFEINGIQGSCITESRKRFNLRLE